MGRAAAQPAPLDGERDRRADLLATLAQQVRPVSLATEERLAVLDGLADLIPRGGLRRGTQVQVTGLAATSLAFALAAGPSQAGSWTAMATGRPDLGLVAAAEAGIVLERLVLVAAADAAALATLVDAFDVVIVRSSGGLGPRDQRRLVARGRERGAVLVRVGPEAWSVPADLELTVTSVAWDGLADGHGHLRARRITVETGGRREAARPRRATLWLPSPGGTVEPAAAPPVPLHRRRSS